MTQGYMLMGLDREDDSTRIDAAYLAALTLKIADPEREVCVMVRDTEELPAQLKAVPIHGADHKAKSGSP